MDCYYQWSLCSLICITFLGWPMPDYYFCISMYLRWVGCFCDNAYCPKVSSGLEIPKRKTQEKCLGFFSDVLHTLPNILRKGQTSVSLFLLAIGPYPDGQCGSYRKKFCSLFVCHGWQTLDRSWWFQILHVVLFIESILNFHACLQTFDAYVVGKEDAPGIVVLQEWWGVDFEIKNHAVKISHINPNFKALIPE